MTKEQLAEIILEWFVKRGSGYVGGDETTAILLDGWWNIDELAETIINAWEGK